MNHSTAAGRSFGLLPERDLRMAPIVDSPFGRRAAPVRFGTRRGPHLDTAPVRRGRTPSPPSEGGEGRGAEGHWKHGLPLSPALSPLLRRGEREKSGAVSGCAPRRVAFNLFLIFLAVFSFDSASGQNIVGADSTSTSTANPVSLTDTDVSESFVWREPVFGAHPVSSEARRIAAKLDAHVTEFLDGAPWMPFHHTLGISGYEAYFAHPDEMFLALAFATPWVKAGTAGKIREFLATQLRSGPAPYEEAGFDYRIGRARESYDVPQNLRRSGGATAAHALGVYAFWAYCRYCADADTAREHWTRVKARMKPLLESDYAFEPRRTNYAKSESEKLNGDLAGLLGLARLARMVKDRETERQSLVRARQFLELRVNLERVNPRVVEKSADATKGLHNFKLARYCALMPEVADALRRHSDGRAVAHLKLFRMERNGWYLAFGDRFIGGENYTNPLHLSRALFTGAAFIEELASHKPGRAEVQRVPSSFITSAGDLRAEQTTDNLAGFVDVPWCRGDFYFIEKCVFTLWADTGRTWGKL